MKQARTTTTQPHTGQSGSVSGARPCRLVALTAACGCTLAVASGAAAAQDEAVQPSQAEIEAWLEAKALPSDIAPDEAPEAPPPPPHGHGFVVEAAIGALGHLGEMKHVSPTSPWFHAKVGWEPANWVMLFAGADVAFGSTEYAPPPPSTRGFALYGFGGGVRFTLQPASWCGLFLQGEFGGALVSEDVLATYGYNDADSLNAYYGGMLGFEWYQISPHYALVATGGARHYGSVFDRELSGRTPLAWLGAAALQYTF